MNKNNDLYKDQLKSLFDDFEADIPSDGWDKLEKSLGTARRATLVRRNWYIGSVAAIAAVLITGILFINAPKQIDETPYIPEVATITHKPVNEETAATNNSNNNIEKEQTKTLIAKHTSAKAMKHTNINIVESIASHPEVEQNTQQTNEPSETTVLDTVTTEEGKKNQPSQEEIEVLIKELQESANKNIFEEDIYTTKSDKPLMLALNARGGLISSQKTSSTHMRLRSADTYNSPSKDDNSDNGGAPNDIISEGITSIIPDESTANNVAEMIHSQPYSVGVTVSKEITNKLSLETGLVYTYLYSESKNTSAGYTDKENQELHYLGIPLNLNYNFLEIGRFNLFTTIGGMIEKDIYGINKINASATSQNFNTNLESKDSDKINLKNPQFSVNAGVGASYAIYGGINIYAKIGGSYYFDAKNHGYKTIYSDKKMLLDINAGLRFQF